MFGLQLKYDGIIYQHAGELLLDFDETRDIRWLCVGNYWKSLNAFTFGQIFGTALITPATYVDDRVLVSVPTLFAGGPRPGEALLTKHFSNKRVIKIHTDDPPTATLIKDPADPGGLKPALRRLDKLIRTNPAVWAEYAVREIYLSFKAKGGEWHKENGFWQFEGRENFYPDEDKEAAVPLAYVQYVRKYVQDALGTTLSERRAPAGALDGYIRRNVVAHLAIHPTTNSNTDPDFDSFSNSARFFHTTRASLASDEVSDELWKVRSLVLPGMLTKMVEAAAGVPDPGRRREVLINQIQDASIDSRLDAFRSRLAEAIALARSGDTGELHKLERELARLPSPIEATPEQGLIYTGDRLYTDAVSILRQMGAGPTAADSRRAFFRVFPELIPPKEITKADL